MQGFPGAIGRQRVRICDLDPAAVRDDDLFVAETGQISGGVYPCHRKDFRTVLLSEIIAALGSAGRVLEKQIQKTAQLDKGTVVFLVRLLVEQEIAVACIPVQSGECEIVVCTYHIQKRRNGKAQRIHIGEGDGADGAFNLKLKPVGAWKNRTRAVKGRDLAGAVFVFQ